MGGTLVFEVTYEPTLSNVSQRQRQVHRRPHHTQNGTSPFTELGKLKPGNLLNATT